MRLKKQFLSILVFLVIFSGFALPPRRAQAFLGIADFGVTVDLVQEAIKLVMNTAAHTLQREIIQQLVQSTVTWANSGFQGNPQYNVNLKQDTLNAANNSATAFIVGLGKNPGLVCAPFRNNITISLRNYYTGQNGGQYGPSFQCTFTGIASNLTNFYDDFSKGGWDTWFAATQIPANNPYDVYVAGTQKIDAAVSANVTLLNKKFQANAGFLDVTPCLAKNPDQPTMDRINAWRNGSNPSDSQAGSQGWLAFDENIDSDYASLKQDQQNGYILYNPAIPAGNCIAHGDVSTPGTVIQNQLNGTVAAPLKNLVAAKDWDEVVSALVTGLTKRIFTSSTGLFTKGNPTAGLPNGSEPPNISYCGPKSGKPSTAGGTGTSTTVYVPDDSTCGNTGTGNNTGTNSGSGDNSGNTGGDTSTGGGAGGVACNISSQSPAGNNPDIVTWTASSALNGKVEYFWQGDGINTASNYDSTLGYARGSSISIAYTTSGAKNMRMVA